MKLSRLYSNDLRFKNIKFKDGLNIIFGQVTDSKSEDPHNLGKSALVHLIDFMLLKEVKNGTYFYNKKNVFKHHTFFLEIELNNGSYLTIKRSFDNVTRVDIKFQNFTSDLTNCEQWDYEGIVLNTSSQTVIPATTILNNSFDFDILKRFNYRKLVGYYIRTQNDYNDVFQLRKFINSTDDIWKPFIFELLGFDSQLLLNRYKNYSEIEKLKLKIRSLESYYKASDIDRINGQIDILNREKEVLETDLDTFNFYLNEKQISEDLIKEIEGKSNSLHKHAYNLRADLELITESLNTNEYLDFDYIKKMFDEVNIYFGEQLERTYTELIEFNKSLIQDRKTHLTKLRLEKKQELKIIDDELKSLGEKRSEILSVLQDDDVINKYKQLRAKLIEKERSIQNLETQRDILFQTISEMKELDEKRKSIEMINKEIEKEIRTGNETLNEIRYLFKSYFESITGKNGIIDISTNTSSNVVYNAGIISKDGTLTHEDEGFSYRKMLCICFDLALLSHYSNKSFFRFVYHDGPFEALHENRKESYLDFLSHYTSKNDVQYIISVIDSDISKDDYIKFENDIVCYLRQEIDGSGSLFGFKY